MTIKWTKWTDAVIRKQHGKIKTYRKLYDGEHVDLFPRAKDLVDNGEIYELITEGEVRAKNIKTPYIVANVSKMIVDIPAMLVSRAMGQVTTSTKAEDFTATENIDNPVNIDVTDQPENPDEFTDPFEKQKEIIKGIAKRSNLMLEHRVNLTQHQIDGGIVGVPFDGENGIRLDFKSRDVYFPHDDGQGCDLVYELVIENDDDFDGESDETYLHVYRERVEENTLYTEHFLYSMDEGGQLDQIEDDATIMEILGMDEIRREFPGRDKPFVVYWPNNKTFTHRLGKSALHGQESKQDEVNWRLTMNSIVYERNGKPRIAVSKEIFHALEQKSIERYGMDKNGQAKSIDHRDLEIVTFDQNGKAMEVIQIDVTKIGDITWVKDIMKIMLMETMTSEKAFDFYQDGGTSAQSGVAKFYDLLNSIIKAESLSKEYVHFIQELFENCLWIENQDDPNVIVEEPKVQLLDMLPISRKELIDQESTAFKNGTQSLRTTVENQNPTASEEWVDDEIDQIEESQASTDSTAIIQGRNTLSNLLDNQNPNGTATGGDNGQTGQGDQVGGQTGQSGGVTQ
jgi:hypothetical protein